MDEKPYAQQLDLLRFQVREISDARLQPDEEARVEQDYRRASNAAKLIEFGQTALALLGEADDAVLTRMSQTSLETKATHGNAYVLSEAKEPPLPSSPNIVRNVLLSIVIGTVLAVVMAIVREYVDRRVRTVEELPMSLGLPLLGVLPRPGTGTARIAGLRPPALAVATAFRSLPAPREGT